jgi:hypothetical protein
MKTNRDRECEDRLLDAVLQDESWQTTSAAFKADALGTFRARQRRLKLVRGSACVVALATVVAGVLLGWGPREAAPAKNAVEPTDASRKSAASHYLTDEELLASFPEGSCLLAEVDGRKELVFLDPSVERLYLAKPNEPGNQ